MVAASRAGLLPFLQGRLHAYICDYQAMVTLPQAAL